jgi:hypothetical protein
VEIRKPTRATRTFTQKLAAPPERVFPLLCPIREADWLEGWDPLVVFTNSGVAEPACVFMTKAAPHRPASTLSATGGFALALHPAFRSMRSLGGARKKLPRKSSSSCLLCPSRLHGSKR